MFLLTLHASTLKLTRLPALSQVDIT